MHREMKPGSSRKIVRRGYRWKKGTESTVVFKPLDVRVDVVRCLFPRERMDRTTLM